MTGIITRYDGPQYDHRGRIVGDSFTLLHPGQPYHGATYLIHPTDDPELKAMEVMARFTEAPA